MEQNNDWVLRDLYAYDKIDMYDIATYEIITNAKYTNYIHTIYTRNNLKYLKIKYQRKNSLPN